MATIDYILEIYQDSNDSVINALIDTLNEDQLYWLIEFLGYIEEGINENLDKIDLQEKAFNTVCSKTHYVDYTIDKLISNYENKNSGKYIFSRLLLRKRYYYLSLSEQSKILKSFLNSDLEEDIRWASYELNARWDSSLLDDVKRLWENYNYDYLDRLIINYAPIDYILDNYSRLDKDCNYTRLCKRLAGIPDFKVDLSRVEKSQKHFGDKDINRLYTHIISGIKIPEEEAKDLLFNKIVDELNRHQSFMPHYIENQDWFTKPLSTQLFPCVKNIIWLMGVMNNAQEIIEFDIWDRDIQDHLYSSDDYMDMQDRKGVSYEDQCWRIFVGYVAHHLPDKYKKKLSFISEFPTKIDLSQKEIEEYNENINKLINDFDLKPIKKEK